MALGRFSSESRGCREIEFRVCRGTRRRARTKFRAKIDSRKKRIPNPGPELLREKIGSELRTRLLRTFFPSFSQEHINRQRNDDNPDTLSRGKNLGDNPPAGIITKKFNDEAGRGVEE